MNDTTPVNVTRTWEVSLYGSYGEGRSASVYLGKRTVTLSGGRDARGQLLPMTATVDGQPVPAAQVVELLEWAKADGSVTLLGEERTVPTIGKARAARLHRLMGCLGLSNPDHYGSARRAVGREVFSLASLTEQEAREVWAYLCRTFPQARQLAP